MESVAMRPSKQSISKLQQLQIETVSGILSLLGLGILVGLVGIILNTNSIVGANIDFGQRVWAFLTTIGIVRPLLAIIASVLFIRLAQRLRTRAIGAARWAKVILIWCIALVIIGIIATTHISLNSESASREASGVEFIIAVAPWGGVLLLLTMAFMLLNRNIHLFLGDENIFAQRTRTAWNLLAPTLIIFLLIGISPLEQVFITSLTDQRFASTQEVNFVGLNNYSKLLGIRLDTLPCEKDDLSTCVTRVDTSGKIITVYPTARRYLSDNVSNYRSSEYRPLDEFDLFGTHFVISAKDIEFYNAFATSVIYSVVAIALQLIIGLFMAMILTSRVRGMTALRVAMLVPLAIPTLIATQFWDVMLLPNDTGVANNFLTSLGFIDAPQQWLLNSALQLPAVILVIVWKETPSMALLLLPGLLSISPEIYQAASVDGANRFQQFFRITLPMMRPTIGVALVLRTMVMLRVFDVFEILLGPRRFSMATYAHDVLIQRQELGYSSTISVAIFAIILFFTIIYMRSLRIDQS